MTNYASIYNLYNVYNYVCFSMVVGTMIIKLFIAVLNQIQKFVLEYI